MVAIDCEMCATRDPVSMEQDGKALIRLSVVSGHEEEVRGGGIVDIAYVHFLNNLTMFHAHKHTGGAP